MLPGKADVWCRQTLCVPPAPWMKTNRGSELPVIARVAGFVDPFSYFWMPKHRGIAIPHAWKHDFLGDLQTN